MPILIVGTVRLPPEKLTVARPVMRRMVDASRLEKGCLGYSYADDLLDPGLIRITELWRDQAALDAHFTSSHLATWRQAWPELGIHDRDLDRYEVGSPEKT